MMNMSLDPSQYFLYEMMLVSYLLSKKNRLLEILDNSNMWVQRREFELKHLKVFVVWEDDKPLFNLLNNFLK